MNDACVARANRRDIGHRLSIGLVSYAPDDYTKDGAGDNGHRLSIDLVSAGT